MIEFYGRSSFSDRMFIAALNRLAQDHKQLNPFWDKLIRD